MTDDSNDGRAPDSMSVAPEEDIGGHHQSDAGRDQSIARRLAKYPESKDARLDTALDESMDASDPPSSTQPVHSHELPMSSGYDPEAEAKLQGH